MRRLVVAAAVLIAAVTAGMAAAADRITGVDLRGYPTVRVTVVAGKESTRAPVVRENGAHAAGQRATNLASGKSVLLAVDRSKSMKGESLDAAIAAARAFVRAKPRHDRVSVTAFGRRALRLTRFSSATIDADVALRTLGVDGQQGTALYDAVALGASALELETQAAKVLILVTDGNDVSSDAGLVEAIETARRAKVAVHAIGIEGPQFSPQPLRRLALETGGSYHGAASPAALTAVYRNLDLALRRTWQIEYVTAARPAERVAVAVGGAARRLAMPGAMPEPKRGASPLLPRSAYNATWGPVAIGVLSGGLVFLALGAAAGARRGSRLRGRLAPHVEERSRRHPGKAGLGAAASLMHATERAFGAFRLWRRVQGLIARADVPLKTVEVVYIAVGSSFVFALAATFLTSSAVFVLVGFALGAAVPFAVLAFKARRRGRAFEEQLPDILLTMAASLKAGHSFKQGLQTVADEGDAPAAKEFQRALAEIRLGRPVESALTEMANRVASKNLEFVITAVTIQGQVGGSLASLFDMVADAVRERQQFARKIRGLTAMGRASAYVLVGLPFALVGMIRIVNGEYLDPLFSTGAGNAMVVIGLVLMTLGSLILKKIVSFRG